MSGLTDGPPTWARMQPERLHHVERVVGVLDRWAEALAVPEGERTRWRTAGWLHDALKDAEHSELVSLLDPEFAAAPRALWHGPAAAARAAMDGENDRGVLDAVRYHTVGCAGWDAVGKMLFLADFLEPGRPFAGTDRDRWSRRVTDGPEGVEDVLVAVLRARIAHRRTGGRAVHPRTEEWWNAIGR